MPEKDISAQYVPAHVGIIMDGNGRWAKSTFSPVPWGIGPGPRTFGP